MVNYASYFQFIVLGYTQVPISQNADLSLHQRFSALVTRVARSVRGGPVLHTVGC